MFLDPAKLLVIVVVALMVLGPDQLPKVAKSTAALLNEIRRFRERLDVTVNEAFPDLPATEEILDAVRSPLTLLERMAVGGTSPAAMPDDSRTPKASEAESGHLPGPPPAPGRDQPHPPAADQKATVDRGFRSEVQGPRARQSLVEEAAHKGQT